MNSKIFLCLAMAGIIAGCSKQEQTPSAPNSQGNSSAAPTAPAAAIKTGLNAPPPEPAATNAQAAPTPAPGNVVASADNLAAAASNAVQTTSPPTNATAQSALGAIDGALKSSLPDATAAPANAAAPSTPGATAPSLADLPLDQVTRGLKEALGKGLQHAVASLGQPGGFLTNVNVKIPLPEKLQSVEKTLRALGQGQMADDCINTMNQAAEQAVPAAADVFAGSLKNMSVDDATGILHGQADAATQYFRHATEKDLTQKFLPIVQQAMTKCGTTAAYERVLDKARVASPFFSNPSLDLNQYVTGKAMDGLFKMVADEEKRIRENPVARSTDLLKSVFGSLQK